MSARARRRPKHRPSIKVKAKPPLTPVQQYREGLAALLPREAEFAEQITRNVGTLVTMARTLTGKMGALQQMRTTSTDFAAMLTAEDPARPLEVPPSPLGISDADPDGALYAALTAGDAQAVAEVLGKLAGAALAREGAPRGC
ncbi:hypothetical protein [Actinomadura geliboluensis]|uniref:hypothetical protein n=1 Tax=Actinomadura geliboluensis TaxID=882440 RepID=UPI0037209A63